MPICRLNDKGETVEVREDITLADVPAHKRAQWRVCQLPREEMVRRVKAEAGRRIEAAVPQWKQNNLNARNLELMQLLITQAGWSGEQEAEAAAIKQELAKITTIRARSNEIEALDPIPEDYDADARWR